MTREQSIHMEKNDLDHCFIENVTTEKFQIYYRNLCSTAVHFENYTLKPPLPLLQEQENLV